MSDTQPGSAFKVRKDSLGLFVNIEGSIYRPNGNTDANEGLKVEFLSYHGDSCRLYLEHCGTEWWWQAVE